MDGPGQEDMAATARSLGPSAQKLAGKTVLVAGGMGFLGRHLIKTVSYLNRNVLSRPARMLVLDNFVTGIRDSEFDPKQVELIPFDIRNPIDLDGGVDFVVHMAGIASPTVYSSHKVETIEVSTLGTRNLLELARKKKVKSFLFLSSSEVYGDPAPEQIPTTESYNGNVSCVGPRACYDESKRVAETFCVVYWQVYHLPVKIARPFNVYGPGMRLDDQRVIPSFVTAAMHNRVVRIYNRGSQTRTFCYISDAMTGFLKILLSDQNGEVFNVGNDQDEITMEALARKVIDIAGSKAKIKKVKSPIEVYAKGDPRRRCPDISKIHGLLGYTPNVALEDGLARFIEWARNRDSAR